MARCEVCDRTYRVDEWDMPATVAPYTCDDCGGYVEPRPDLFGEEDE